MESLDISACLFRDKKHIYTVLELLNKQRLTRQLCDVILQICDVKIAAHACVLASASPYFEELFADQSQHRQFCPKSPQIIEIHIDGNEDPMYKKAVEKVIDFMYTSKITIEDGILAQVSEIARIMKMGSILDLCSQFGVKIFGLDSANRTSIQTVKDSSTQTSSEELTQINPSSQSEPTSSSHRKRGRPRKVTSGNQTDSKNITSDTKSCNNEESEDTKVEVQHDDSSDVETISQPPQISKRGRVIKPRKYSDVILYSTIKVKQEVREEIDKKILKDIGESESNVDRQFGKRSKDEELDPSYVHELRREKSYQCDSCSFTTTKPSEFKAHNKSHLDSEKKCSFCGWVSKNPDSSNEEFEEHMKTHCGSEPYYCSFCPLRFSTKAKLYQHLPKHSKVRPYVCEICEASFKWKQALKTHMATHKTIKDFLCDICGFATAHKAQLKAHHLLHTGDMFQCPHPGCGYETTKKSNLKYHMFTHTREKPHQCEVCGQSFSLVKNLRRHMLLHSADRPFKCNWCGFSTTRFDKLKEHFYKHHNIGKKPAKKLKLTDYFKQQAESLNMTSSEQVDPSQDGVVLEEAIIPASELPEGQDVETIELTVDESVPVLESGAQIVNISSTTGEPIPIVITQDGKEIIYEITSLGDVNMVEGSNETSEMEVSQIPYQIVSVNDVIEEAT